jgi:hypothetical protein
MYVWWLVLGFEEFEEFKAERSRFKGSRLRFKGSLFKGLEIFQDH